jgi:hypothetical protein
MIKINLKTLLNTNYNTIFYLLELFNFCKIFCINSYI